MRKRNGNWEWIIRICCYEMSFFMYSLFPQQFVKGTFESSYYPTAKKETYYPSVVHRDRSYNLEIVDIADVPYMTVSSFYNLSDLKGKSKPKSNTLYKD